MDRIAMEQRWRLCVGGKDGGYAWTLQGGLSLNNADLATATAECTICQQNEAGFLKEMNQALAGYLITFHPGRVSDSPGTDACSDTNLHSLGLPWWLSGKESTCNAGDLGLIPG